MVEFQERIDRFSAALKSEVRKVERIGGGRNSRVFRLICADGHTFVAKTFHSHASDPRDRLGVEFKGLRFMWDHGIRDIPRALASDPIHGFSIYEYVPGRPVDLVKIGVEDIDHAADFLIRLERLKTEADAAGLPPASEAFFSVAEIIGNIEYRLQKLLGVREDDILGAELHIFLRNKFNPLFDRMKTRSQKRLAADGYSTDYQLPVSERTLSPSDFGFHNALRKPDGGLVFLDFEYFGWDDPAKMISDFMLHPAMELSGDLSRRFLKQIVAHFGDSGRLLNRLKAVYPLFGLKWLLILLNEFIPADLARREFASLEKMNTEATRTRQLALAEKMMNEVEDYHEQKFEFS
jgi:hypothetical protein